MDRLELILYNVGHGMALSLIEYPEKYVTQIDLGSEPNFSPLTHLLQMRQLRTDVLYITHPHGDHLSDVANASKPSFRPDYLHYQEYDWNNVASRERPEARHLISQFRELTRSVPRGAYRGNGSVRVWRWTPQDAVSVFGEPSYINNSSLCIIYTWRDFRIAICGDLETESMDKLISNSDFQEGARKTDILVAPHHGHIKGYTERWPATIGKPHVTLISVQSRDQNVAPGYRSSDFARGIQFAGTERYCLTTRNDGTIVVKMSYGANGKPTWHFASE